MTNKRPILFVSQVIRPWVRTPRAQNIKEDSLRLREMNSEDVHASVNSYLGLLLQATGSHHDHARLANIARRRGHAISGDLTKFRAPWKQTQMETL